MKLDWIKNNKKGLIRGMFLVPIILTMIVSISHVISWYNLANPINWAVFMSIAIEVAAMSSIAAASVKIKGGIWAVFIIVSLVQFIGNVYFSFKEIDILSQGFKDWVDLTAPIFEAIGSDIADSLAQRRWLAVLEGGLLPIISLTSLHFFIRYGGTDDTKKEKTIEEPIVDTPFNNGDLYMEPSIPGAELVVETPKIEETPIEMPKIEENPLVINMRKTGLR